MMTSISSELLISLTYEALLKRQVDESSMNHWLSHLQIVGIEQGYIDMLRTILNSNEFFLRTFPIKKGFYDMINDYCYVFLHVNKTGGFSLNLMMKAAIGEEKVTDVIHDLISYPLSYLSEKLIIDTHSDIDSVRAIIPKKLRVFTILRNPYDRLISFYRFAKSFDKRFYNKDSDPFIYLADELDLLGFYSEELVRETFFNSMTWQVIGAICYSHFKNIYLKIKNDRERKEFLELEVRPAVKSALENFMFVGITEDFENSTKILFDCLGFPFPGVFYENVTDKIAGKGTTKKEPVPKYYADDRFKELVKDLVAFDEITYEEGKKIYLSIKERHLKGDLSFKDKEILPIHYRFFMDKDINELKTSSNKMIKVSLNNVIELDGLFILSGSIISNIKPKGLNIQSGKCAYKVSSGNSGDYILDFLLELRGNKESIYGGNLLELKLENGLVEKFDLKEVVKGFNGSNGGIEHAT